MFENNTAPYGDSIGSYPITVFINDTFSNTITLDNAASGQIYPYPFTASIVDYDG